MNDFVNLKARTKMETPECVTTASIKIYGLALLLKFQDADRIFRPIQDRRTFHPGSSGSKTVSYVNSNELNLNASNSFVDIFKDTITSPR